MIYTQPTIKGFTLVELLVTMAIFITVITIATGALFSAQVVNTRLEQTQIILDGVNLATELIARDIRYGSYFYCDTALPAPITAFRKNCTHPTGGTVIVFRPTIPLTGTTNESLDRVAYYLENGILYKKEHPYGGQPKTLQITSSDVNITALRFYSVGLNTSSGLADVSGATDLNQPLITLVLSGVTVPQKINVQPVSFSVQTSSATRTIDN